MKKLLRLSLCLSFAGLTTFGGYSASSISLAQEPLPQGEAAVQPEVLGDVAPEAPKEYLKKLFQRQWVRVNSEGAVVGTVQSLTIGGTTGVANVNVKLVSKGSVIVSTKTDSLGGYVLPDVAPGWYSLIGNGNGSFFAYSLVVLPAGNEPDPGLVSYAVSPKGDFALRYLGRESQPGWKFDWTELGGDVMGIGREFSTSPQILIGADGMVRGRIGRAGEPISFDMSNMMVYVVQGDKEVAAVEVNGDGSFAVGEMKPGVYGLVVSGMRGFAAVGFEAVTAGGVSAQVSNSSAQKLVSRNLQEAELNIELIPPTNVIITEETFEEVSSSEDPLAMGAPLAGGGFGGPGSTGGGGGGGGGGGLGGIGALAGLAGVAAAIASSDDGFNAPAIASPVR